MIIISTLTALQRPIPKLTPAEGTVPTAAVEISKGSEVNNFVTADHDAVPTREPTTSVPPHVDDGEKEVVEQVNKVDLAK